MTKHIKKYADETPLSELGKKNYSYEYIRILNTETPDGVKRNMFEMTDRERRDTVARLCQRNGVNVVFYDIPWGQ